MGHAVRRETGFYPARGMWLRRLIVRCTRRPIFFCGKKDWGEKAAKREDPMNDRLWRSFMEYPKRASRLYSLLCCTRVRRPRPGEVPPKDIPSDNLGRGVVALGFGVSPRPYTGKLSSVKQE